MGFLPWLPMCFKILCSVVRSNFKFGGIITRLVCFDNVLTVTFDHNSSNKKGHVLSGHKSQNQ